MVRIFVLARQLENKYWASPTWYECQTNIGFVSGEGNPGRLGSLRDIMSLLWTPSRAVFALFPVPAIRLCPSPSSESRARPQSPPCKRLLRNVPFATYPQQKPSSGAFISLTWITHPVFSISVFILGHLCYCHEEGGLGKGTKQWPIPDLSLWPWKVWSNFVRELRLFLFYSLGQGEQWICGLWARGNWKQKEESQQACSDWEQHPWN